MRRVKSVIKVGFLGMAVTLGLGLVSCTSESGGPEEPVEMTPTEIPAAPRGLGEGGDMGEMVRDFQAEKVYFAFDQSSLSAAAYANLDELRDYLQGHPSVQLKIEGHCDERGTEEYNLALGNRRAYSVKNYLVKQGVDGARISTVSYGETRPVIDAQSEAAYAKNRRAEFVLTY